MSAVTFTLLVVAAIGILILITPSVANALVRRSLRPRYFVYGSNFMVGPDWAEMTGIKPERKRTDRQVVSLCIEGYEFDRDDDSLAIKLTDGRVVDPEVQVLDSSGNIFETEDGTRFGNTIGLSVLPRGDIRLSSEKQEAVIRIRSNEPFLCRSIGWHTKRGK